MCLCAEGIWCYGLAVGAQQIKKCECHLQSLVVRFKKGDNHTKLFDHTHRVNSPRYVV